MNDNSLNLSPRLKKIAELVPPNCCTADIGTDHAYIPIALVSKGIAPRAIASDIKKGPLERASANIFNHGLKKKIETRLGAGLTTLSKDDKAEVIIIAGMGGILISDILEASQDIVKSAKFLILQPMTAVTELRKYLSENQYGITAEYLEAEEEKIYNIITAKPVGNTPYTLSELYLGKGLDKTSPHLVGRYEQSVLAKLTKRIDGLEKSQNPENKRELEETTNLLKSLNAEVNFNDKIIRNN